MSSKAQRPRSDTARNRSGLEVLRARIRAAHVPPARAGNLRLATWNIRELGKGERLPESVAMIAEVLRCFDFVSIVELRDDVRDLMRVMKILGKHWSVVFSDYIRDAGGNRERLAFVFDTRRVTFTGLAGNAEGPRRRVNAEYYRKLHWWRPPFLASFRAGTFDFVVVAAHLRWGPTSKGRLGELDALLSWVGDRSREAHFGERDLLVVGDFNVLGPGTPAFDLVRRRGFRPPPALERVPSTSIARLARGKRYDQILSSTRVETPASSGAGVVDFYCGDHRALFPARRLSKARFTTQLSDHLPLWVELATGGQELDSWAA